MNTERAKKDGVLDSMVMAGVPIALIYWILDSILKIFFYNQHNLVTAFLGEDLYELYTRVIVLCLLLIFGAHAQYSINRLKKTRDALKEAEQEHRRFIENLNTGIFRCPIGSTGRFIRANRAMAAMFGYRHADEFKQTALLDIFPGFAELKQFIDIFHDKTHVRGREMLLKKRDGQQIWVTCSASAAGDAGKNTLYIDGVMEDITERKQAEETLRNSEEKYRLLANHAPAGIFEVDMATAEFKNLNEVLCEMTGFARAELFAKKCYDILTEESRSYFFKSLVKLHSKETVPRVVELEIRRNDGTIFPAAFNTRYHYQFGQLISATVVVHDITRRKQIEKEKQRLQTQLFRAQKMEAIGTLAGGIAHDFNNLLMGIQAHVSLMMSSTDYLHPYLKHFFAIENHIKSASDLTNKLLGFAQGKQRENKAVSLNPIIREQIRIFAESRQDVQVHEHFEEDSWPVIADPIELKQVVLNLILNAMQAMPHGGHLHARTENRFLEETRASKHRAKAGRYTVLIITDTGVGMEPKILQRIFEPFFTTKTMGPRKGNGMGLATVYGIVQNHGGFIAVSSEPQQGSAFSVFLPAAGKQTAGARKLRSSPAPAPRETILAIDSDAEVLAVLEKMLSRLGYRVLTAGTARRALALFQQNCDCVDLVIIDSASRNIESRRLTIALKKINPNVKILPSGHANAPQAAKDSNERALSSRAFLRKPFSLNQLSQELQANLE